MPRPRHVRPRLRPAKPRRADGFVVVVIGVSVAAFAATIWIVDPEAPGRAEVRTLVEMRTTDQHYASCADARRDGRRNIPRWDPSYRTHMDRDRDGRACEPYIF